MSARPNRAFRTLTATIVLSTLCLAPGAASLGQETEDSRETRDGFIGKIEALWYRIPHEERELPWLVGDFNWGSGLFTLAFGAYAASVIAGDNPVNGLDGRHGDVEQLGDDIYKAIPGTAYALTVVSRDWHGLILMGLHNALSSAVMQQLKDGVGQRRPNDSSNTSFPSGHTNTAFIGAAFIQQRYGSMWGIPAYIAAGYVGYSRMYGNKHYMNDVISGASIAMLSSWMLVPPYDSERRALWSDMDRHRAWRYEWEMTLNNIDENLLQTPGGDPFTNPLNPADERWANSHIELEYNPSGRHFISGRFSPWEIRSYGQLATPVDFAGVTLPANQQLRSAHLQWNFTAKYRYQLFSNDWLDARIGAGLTAMFTESEIFVVDDTNPPERRGITGIADAATYYPVIHGAVRINPFWKLHLVAEVDHGAGSSSYTDWTARVDVRFNNKWTVGLGYREYESDLDENTLVNRFRRSGTAFTASYSF